MKNNDPFQPWNNPMYQDDPFAPHNNPMRKDNPFEEWNNPMGKKERLNSDDKKSYGIRDFDDH